MVDLLHSMESYRRGKGPPTPFKDLLIPRTDPAFVDELRRLQEPPLWELKRRSRQGPGIRGMTHGRAPLSPVLGAAGFAMTKNDQTDPFANDLKMTK